MAKDDPATRRREAMHLQALEGNPVTADDLEMFEMFDREGWSHDKRRAYIIELALSGTKVSAAE